MKKNILKGLIIAVVVLIIGNLALSTEGTGNLFSKIQRTTLTGINEFFDNITGSFTNLGSTFSESLGYDDLKQELQEEKTVSKALELENQKLLSENEKLRSERNLPKLKNSELLNGEIIQKSFADNQRLVTINIGTDNGLIKVGDQVVYGEMLWGEVIETKAGSSIVKMYADENANIYIPAKTKQENPINGEIIKYDFQKGAFVFEPFNPEQILKEGQQIITGDYSQNIPSGIALGTIEEIEGSGANIKYLIKPVYSPYDVEFVSVVINGN